MDNNMEGRLLGKIHCIIQAEYENHPRAVGILTRIGTGYVEMPRQLARCETGSSGGLLIRLLTRRPKKLSFIPMEGMIFLIATI
jgi:hypothetical protein